MNVKWYISDAHACGFVRGESPARSLNAHYNCRVDVKSDIFLSDFYGTELMVFQRQHRPEIISKMQRAKRHGIAVVYDVDDDLWHMPPEFDEPHQFYARPEVQSRIMEAMNASHAITVSTEPLAEAVRERMKTHAVMVLPNALDVADWEAAYAKRQSDKAARRGDESVTIGWMASGSHKIDAPLVMGALEEVLRARPQAQAHFIGWVGFEEATAWLKANPHRMTAHQWTDVALLPWAMSGFDIGLAPLSDNQFNRCKSPIKAFQYWALGIPIVASPMPMYRETVGHGKTGYLAGEPSEWTAYLVDLIDHPERRERMGAAGRQELLARHDMRHRAGDWLATWKKIAAAI